MTDYLSLFRKKFPRVALNERQADLVRGMKSMEIRVQKEERKLEIRAEFDAWREPDVLFSLEDDIK
ncbi:MAG: hypothetical protein ILO68_01830, partial [Clostridia bacterium]|nr:hypothetical protein [Clostridia bacterium]